MKTTIGAATGFVLAAAAANYATDRLGMVPVGFGLTVTAGTFAAGLALALRDTLQDTAGRPAVLGAIAGGVIASVATSSPGLALASGAAFAVSEILDALVYTPLRGRAATGTRRWSAAVAGSNLAGSVADTLVFVALVPFLALTWPVIAGQLLGKGYATLAYLAGGAARRRHVLAEDARIRASLNAANP